MTKNFKEIWRMRIYRFILSPPLQTYYFFQTSKRERSNAYKTSLHQITSMVPFHKQQVEPLH